MFVSTCRPVVYPQFEHARLAGTIAQYWGNQRFKRPGLPFDAFCTGVALHDFGYGLLDTHDILGMDATERRGTFESLMHMRFDDPIVEIVAKTHVARLMNMSGLLELEAQCRRILKNLIVRSGLSEVVFQDADTITRLCDSVAFDFCFEKATSGSVSVMAEQGSSDTIDIRYEINFQSRNSHGGVGSTSGHITLAPWPLSCSRVQGYLFAYDRSGYPDVLKPHWVGFEICPG